jgi:predicted transcriptional regulator
MKFNPCIPGKCTEEGTHCEGCGRTHEEIAETKKLVKDLVSFSQKMGYENIEDFSSFIGQSLLKKLQNPS